MWPRVPLQHVTVESLRPPPTVGDNVGGEIVIIVVSVEDDDP